MSTPLEANHVVDTKSSSASEVPAISAELSALRLSEMPPPSPQIPPTSTSSSSSSTVPELVADTIPDQQLPKLDAALSSSTQDHDELDDWGASNPERSALFHDELDDWGASNPEQSALAFEYSHVSRVLLAPPLLIGASPIAANPKLPGLLYSLLKQRLQNTRLWIKDEVLSWLKRSDDTETCRMFVILGGAGTGKSVISAMLVEQLLSLDIRVGALHFCRFDDPASSSPEMLLSSLAAQLASSIRGFGASIDGEAVEHARERGDADLLFESLVAAPIRAALEEEEMSESCRSVVVIVIDALDELPPSALRPVLTLLSKRFVQLPPRVRLVVTAREQGDIKEALGRFDPVLLLVDELHNRQDIRKFLSSVAADCVELSMTMQDVAEKVAETWPGLDVKQLGELEGPLQSSKLCYDVAADTVSTEPGYKKLCGIQELRSEPPLEQTVVGGNDGRDRDLSFNILMADAGDARAFLMTLVADSWEPMHDKPTMQVPVPGTARRWIENAIDPGLKGEGRAIEKAQNDYGGNVLLLKDLARLSLEFTGCENMYSGYEELKKCPGVEIVGIKNKFANPTPMGYRDLNLSVRVTLPDGRKHICEVQINLVDMLKAKHDAHKDYGIVRSRLPAICKSATGGGAKADDVEKFVMKLLQSSVLDSAVKNLEEKAGGLFIYAKLLEAQLKEMQRETGGRKVDFSKLGALPRGLAEMYKSNFQRTFAEKGSWELCKKIVAMIAVAREPLPETLVKKVVGSEEYRAAKTAMSLLFPAREGRLHVMHKSVVDWLMATDGERAEFRISEEDKTEAHSTLARQLWLYENWKSCGVDDSWEYEMDAGEKYSVTYGHVHLKEALAGEETGAAATAISREWHDALLERRHNGRDSLEFALGDDTESEPKPRENKCDLSPERARAAAGLLIMRHAKMGRIKKFTAELRELLAEFARVEAVGFSCCTKTRRLTRFVEDCVAVLGAKFNSAFVENKKDCFKNAVEVMLQFVPQPSSLKHSEAEESLLFWKPGTFKYVMTLPHRINNSPVIIGMEGHSGEVFSVAFNLKGSRAISGGNDCTAKIWNAATGEVEITLIGHSEAVTSVAFNLDGTRVISGSDDKTVKLWNTSTGDVERTFTGHTDYVRSVAFNHDCSRLVSGSDDKTVKIWNSATGLVEHTLRGHSGAVMSVAYSRDGTRIVSGSKDKTVKIWTDWTTEGAEQTLVGHSAAVNSVAFNNDGKRVVSGSWDKVVKLWDAATGVNDATLQGHTGRVWSVAFSHDGKRVVSGSWDKTVKIWNAATGEVEQTLAGHSSYVRSVAFNKDGTRVVSGSDEGAVKIWSTAIGNAKSLTLEGHSDVVMSAVFNQAGTRVVSAGWDATLRTWDAATGDHQQTYLQGHSDRVWSVAFNVDGTRIASGSNDKTVKIWDVVTGLVEHTLLGHSDSVWSVAFDHSGLRVVSGSSDKTLRIWNAVSGDVELTSVCHVYGVMFVAFNFDGTRVVSGSDDKTVKTWSAKTGDIEMTFQETGAVKSVAFNLDGTRVISGSDDKTIKLWNTSTGDVERTFIGHTDYVRSVAFNHDCSRLVSGSDDKTVKIWNSATGDVEYTLRGHAATVYSVAFNDDGTRIVSCGEDKTVKIWSAARWRGASAADSEGNSNWVE